MMAEVNQSRELVSQINHIKVEPDNQEELVDQMMRNLRDVVAPAKGFISSTIFRSLDGKDVVNFVQWASPELLEEVHEADAFKSQLDRYRSVGCGVNDVVAGQNGGPVWFKEDGTRVDADQRRRDEPRLTGTAFRQAFNPLQRRQIRSPKPSLQNKLSHRRH